MELVTQKARLEDVMDRVQKKWSCVPTEIQTLQEELAVLIQEAKEKVLQFSFISITESFEAILLGSFTTHVRNVLLR